MKVGALLAVLLVFALVISTPEVVEAGPAPVKSDKNQQADKKANDGKTSNKAKNQAGLSGGGW